jgi:hypothetical protein
VEVQFPIADRHRADILGMLKHSRQPNRSTLTRVGEEDLEIHPKIAFQRVEVVD